MKYLLFSLAIGLIFYASYLYDIMLFKREIRRRNLNIKRYEQLINSLKNK